MTATLELNSCRKKLEAALGQNATAHAGGGNGGREQYFTQMKNWFRKRITKEAFDREARQLLLAQHTHLHNEFLLAILNKCQTLANFTGHHAHPQPSGARHVEDSSLTPAAGSSLSSSAESAAAARGATAGTPTAGPSLAGVRVRRGQIPGPSSTVRRAPNGHRGAHFEQRFQAVNVNAVAPNLDELDLYEEERSLGFCARESPALPDRSLVHGRMLLTAWEEGLDSVEDDTVRLVEEAVGRLLRRLIWALVMQRNGYRLRDGVFPHTAGVGVPDGFLINAQNRVENTRGGFSDVADTIDHHTLGKSCDLDPLVPAVRPLVFHAERQALMDLACSYTGYPAILPSKPNLSRPRSDRVPISVLELLDVITRNRNLIPAHSVFALNVERVIARLHHADYID